MYRFPFSRLEIRQLADLSAFNFNRKQIRYVITVLWKQKPLIIVIPAIIRKIRMIDVTKVSGQLADIHAADPVLKASNFRWKCLI